MGERREEWEKDGEKMREKGDKGKKGEKGEREWDKEVEGERKKKRSRRRLPPILPLIDSGTVFVFLESQMHITPPSFEN